MIRTKSSGSKVLDFLQFALLLQLGKKVSGYTKKEFPN